MALVTCPECNQEVSSSANTCPHCGYKINSGSVNTLNSSNFNLGVDDNPGCLMNGLCFLIPIVGLVMYLVKKDTQPNCAKSYGLWGLVGFCVSLVLNLLIDF